jgi:hypothetical protein
MTMDISINQVSKNVNTVCELVPIEAHRSVSKEDKIVAIYPRDPTSKTISHALLESMETCLTV